VENINDVVKVGQEIKAKVIRNDDYNEIYLDMRLE
jgi:predicted RNA-binding protein with RPS1 domain